ncbi:MAG: hypothetical protein ACOH5I_07860 [Oligoflexus sp.]
MAQTNRLFKQSSLLAYSLTFFTLSSCGEPSSFRELPANPDSSIGGPNSNSPYESHKQSDELEGVVIVTEDDPGIVFEPVEVGDNGNASKVEKNQQDVWRETFLFGGQQSIPLVDYLIVMDNSCSMERIIAPTASGFMSLVGSESLPAKARVGVMNSMHGDENNLSTTGIGINRYPGIDLEPGFLELVNRQSIIDFKAATDSIYADKWQMLGCADKWFRLDDVSPEGDSCLVAATQASYQCVGAEAGIRAFRQILEKSRTQQPLFREGAIVNVIFVSDTHDPGTNIDFLKQSVPTYGELLTLVNETHNLSGVKFHALAPDSQCTTEGLHERSYHQLTEQSAGKWQNPCQLNDYEDFFADMVESSDVAEHAIFTLSQQASSIERVLVNGEATQNYRVIGLKSIVIDELDRDEKHTVEIYYQMDTNHF